jgi:hypothetical protein
VISEKAPAGVVDVSATATQADGAPPPHRLGRRLAAMGVALALIAGFTWWLINPSSLQPYGSGLQGHAAVGETAHYAAYIAPEDGQVTLREVMPVVTQNTAGAVIEVTLCRQGEDADQYGGWGGALSAHCVETAPVSGATLDSEPGPSGVVVSVTPQQPGIVTIEGFDVSYRDGWRRGLQRAGIRLDVTTTVPPPAP